MMFIFNKHILYYMSRGQSKECIMLHHVELDRSLLKRVPFVLMFRNIKCLLLNDYLVRKH